MCHSRSASMAVAEESDALSDEANSRVMCHVSSLRGNWSQAFLEKVCRENPSRSKTETHRAAHRFNVICAIFF